MEHSSFGLKVKSVDDAGRFTGLLASYNTVDLGGDKILPGAFSKTLSGAKQFPLLWQHDPAQPIGSFKATETSQGLQIEGQLILSIQTAKDARELLRHGVLKGLSIGYDTIKADYVGDVRELSELRLWEGSIVTFPMNQSAMVTGIKGAADEDKAKHLAAITTHQKAIAHHSRGLAEHVKALCGLDNDGDDSELDEYGEMSMALVLELKDLAAQAQELASA